jgi:hypothetical protein
LGTFCGPKSQLAKGEVTIRIAFLTGAAILPKRIMTDDLHGCSVPEALSVAMDALANRPELCEKVNFLAGRGIHSKDSILLLKIAVQEEVTKRGDIWGVMTKDSGILVVFFYEISPASVEKSQIFFMPHATM